MGGEIIRRIIGDYLIAPRRGSLFFYMPNERAGDPLALEKRFRVRMLPDDLPLF